MPKGPELRPWDDAWLDKRVNIYALITPDKAAELIGTNLHNRRKKEQKINQYAADMAAGKWHPESASLKWSWDKVLLDGQNRLIACIQADAPFGTLVQTGLDPASQPHIDVGAVRTMGDVFKMAGVPDPNNIASAISLRARYESIVDSGQTIIEKRLPMTRAEALQYLDAHPQIEKMSSVGRSMYPAAPGIQRAVWLAGVSMAAEVDEPGVRTFAARFTAGDIRGPGDPVLALIRYAASLNSPKEQARAQKVKNAGIRNLTAFVKAWNANRKDEHMDRLTVREDEKPPAVV
jgi:hypothetical protein